MNSIDIAIAAIIMMSAIISVVRGFVKESISLASWLLAVWVALTFSGKLALLLPDSIEMPSLRVALSMAILFTLSLLAGGLANFFISTLVSYSGLSGTDRALGVVFGVLRGVVIVAALVLLGGLLQFSAAPWWQESQLLDYFQTVAVWIRELLPEDVAKHLVFPSKT